ncbi:MULTISPECIES: TIGR03943 family putative permease subunit [Paenibacillus]|jgi:putative membrane protein|uniref:TIGR03943 family putative permease subunit n=1 Tax=Paenibacillus TaxID=44249 RepID=UPI00073EDCDB|nr:MULTISPECIES: TIGR03943 family protein [Paenibacillus]MDU4695815.1 TIGR03943 family protein [Paenibacillus sp.]
MNHPRVIRRHYLARSLILLGFALFIAHLTRSGAMHYYIGPRMEPLLRFCPFPLAVMAVCLAYQALFQQSAALCDCERPLSVSRWKNGTVYGLFLLPLLLGTLLPDQALGSSAAAKKGMSLSSPLLASERLEELFRAPDPYNNEFAELAKRLYPQDVVEVKPEIFSETIGAMELFADQFRGKRVKLSGFVYQEPGSQGKENELILGRFLVLCCTADSAPFGLVVTADQPLVGLTQDSWLEVEGTIEPQTREGKAILTVKAERIREIPRPKTPYVYPSEDSVKAWDNLSGPED